MSGYMQSMFVFTFLFTLFSFSIIPAINGQPPFRNRFDRQPFEREPDPACADTPDSGSGQQLLHVWFFSMETAQCRELVYRGYGGSSNLFPNRRECERRCLRPYTEGAEQSGPKIKATVEHLVDKSNTRRNIFSHRSAQLDYQFRQRKGRNGRGRNRKMIRDDRDFDYGAGGHVSHGKPAPHPRSLTPYDDQ